MRLPDPRGPLSRDLAETLRGAGPCAPVPARDTLVEDDWQLALWILYALHGHGFDDVPEEAEWDPELLAVRRRLEGWLEADLVASAAPLAEEARSASADLVEQLGHIVSAPWTSVAGHLHREATHTEFSDFLAVRSLYFRKEADAYAWVVPRLDGPAKTALAELQYDEYGAGRTEDLHQRLYAEALTSMGLEEEYGAYVDRAGAPTLASVNAASLLGLHRRLRGAAMGHLAALEMTSSVPCRRIVQGAERLGLPAAVVRYFDEHVEADAVHEHLAARDICGSLVAAEPTLADQVLLGAAVCVTLDGREADWLLHRWERGEIAVPGEHRVA